MKTKNSEMIPYVSNKMLASGKKENWQVRFSILFIIFFITTTIGYFCSSLSANEKVRNTYNLENVDYVVNTESEHVIEAAQKLSYLDTVGVNRLGGSITVYNKESDSYEHITMHYVDFAYWNNQHVPEIKNMSGNYPSKNNEIMLSNLILHQLGIQQPQLGMKIPLEVAALVYKQSPQGKRIPSFEKVKQRFILSGYYDDEKASTSIEWPKFFCSEAYYMENKSHFDSIKLHLKLRQGEKRSERQILTDLLSGSSDADTDTLVSKPDEYHSIFELKKNMIWKLSPILLLIAYFVLRNMFSVWLYKNTKVYESYQDLGMTQIQIKQVAARNLYMLCIVPTVVGMTMGLIASAAYTYLLYHHSSFYMDQTLTTTDGWTSIAFNILPLLLTIVTTTFLLVISVQSSLRWLRRRLQNETDKTAYDKQSLYFFYPKMFQNHDNNGEQKPLTKKRLLGHIASQYFGATSLLSLGRALLSSICAGICICSMYWINWYEQYNPYESFDVVEPVYIGTIGILFFLINLFSELILTTSLYQMRTREMAVMEAVGMQKNDIVRVIRKESNIQARMTIFFTITLSVLMSMVLGIYFNTVDSINFSNILVPIPIFTIILFSIAYWMIYNILPFRYRQTKKQDSLSNKLKSINK